MSATIQTDPLLFCEDAAGALRIGRTRVLAELVLRAFQDGATPEAIVQRYPSLSLADAYAAIGYYSHHREKMDEYLSLRERQAEEVRGRIDGQQGDLADLRHRLLSETGK